MPNVPVIEDKTNDIIQVLSGLEGYSTARGLTKIEDHTSSFLGERFGYEVRARGNATLVKLIDHKGQLLRMSGVFANPFWYTAEGTQGLSWTFSFKGWTQAESWTVPGGARVDYPWKDIKVSGKIKYNLLSIPGDNQTLRLTSIVFDRPDDRPNNFLKSYVISSFLGVIDDRLEKYTKQSINS